MALSNSLKLNCYKNQFLQQFIYVKHIDCSGAWAWTKDSCQLATRRERLRLPLMTVGARSNGVIEELKGSKVVGLK